MILGSHASRTASMSPAFHASKKARTISTFSCDIARAVSRRGGRTRGGEGLAAAGFALPPTRSDRPGVEMVPLVEFSDLIRQLDPRPDVRGRQFERLCRWFLLNASEYRWRIKNVWFWKDWPDAWAGDAGIDLVAEENDGSLWAVQAKAYGQDYAIKKA